MNNKQKFTLHSFEEGLTASTDVGVFRVGDIIQYHPEYSSDKEKFEIYLIENYTELDRFVPGKVVTELRVRVRSVDNLCYHGSYRKSFPFIKIT